MYLQFVPDPFLPWLRFPLHLATTRGQYSVLERPSNQIILIITDLTTYFDYAREKAEDGEVILFKKGW